MSCSHEARPHGDCVCFIAPPNLLARIAEAGKPEARSAAIAALATSASMRTRRAIITKLIREDALDITAFGVQKPPNGMRRSVHDVEHGGRSALPGKKVRGEGDPDSADDAVNEAYVGSGQTYDFYKEVCGRNSIDDQGMELVSSVHYGVDFDNAMWDGTQMIYGDGSGRLFKVGGFTKALDVIAHELTHGVTEFTAGLAYHKQSGALNESFSDVFGSLVKQYVRGQSVAEADWLIGEGILGPALPGKALRSMDEPGTANEYDEQPDHMSRYQDLPDDNDPRNDNGGVHINSGIPNRAFCLAAKAIGGYAWEKTGRIWYAALTKHLQFDSDFGAAAQATVTASGDLFGADSVEQQAVRNAWEVVGVLESSPRQEPMLVS